MWRKRLKQKPDGFKSAVKDSRAMYTQHSSILLKRKARLQHNALLFRGWLRILHRISLMFLLAEVPMRRIVLKHTSGSHC